MHHVTNASRVSFLLSDCHAACCMYQSFLVCCALVPHMSKTVQILRYKQDKNDCIFSWEDHVCHRNVVE